MQIEAVDRYYFVFNWSCEEFKSTHEFRSKALFDNAFFPHFLTTINVLLDLSAQDMETTSTVPILVKVLFMFNQILIVF